MNNASQGRFDKFCWADVFVPDVAGAKAFYGALFDWSLHTEQMENGMRYSQMSKTAADGDAKPVAGIGLKWTEDLQESPNLWYCHILTRNIEQSVEKVSQAGGIALAEIIDILDLGRLATCLDDCGQVFCLWQPLKFAGAQLMKTNGALTWFELITQEPENAVEFYESVLGWTTKECEITGGTYWVFELEGQAVAGMHSDLSQAGGSSQWMPYIQVAGVDAAAAACTALNGSLVFGPDVEPSVGTFAILSDDQQSMFGVAQYEPEFERQRTA